MCARAQCAARERVDWGQVPTRRHAWLPSDIGGPQVALGRAGDGPKVFPWWEAALVALCGARGRDLRSATFPRLAPPRLWLGLAPRSSAGPNFERFLERCPLDSKFSCDNIWVSKCMLFLRSSNLFDGWLDLPPLGVVHAWVGQIVTFFAYRPPSRPLGSLTPTQPGRVTNPTQGHPEPPWEAPQAECWLLRREPKPPA